MTDPKLERGGSLNPKWKSNSKNWEAKYTTHPLRRRFQSKFTREGNVDHSIEMYIGSETTLKN